MKPLRLNFYKGLKGTQGAVQFNLQLPHFYLKQNPKLKNYDGDFILEEWKKKYPEAANATDKDMVSREGCLFMEITSAVGENVYNWDEKIVMAISVMDMGKLLTVLEGLETEVTLFHDPKIGTSDARKVAKIMTVSSPQGLKTGVVINVSQKEGDKTTRHTVALSGAEAKVLSVCIRAIIPVSLGLQ